VTLRPTHDEHGDGARRTTLDRAWRATDPPTALVIGFGNILLGDDGAGVQLVERMRTQFPRSACEFVDGGTMSFSLLSYVEAASALLVVDAAELGSPPGTTILLEGEAMDSFLKSARRRTVHEMGLMDLLDMARLENCLPRRRALLCIQPAFIDWSETLSPRVEAAFAGAAAQARTLLARWCLI
jgi:hydrogenase maturation protease